MTDNDSSEKKSESVEYGKMMKIVSVIFLIFGIVALTFYRNYNEDLKLGWFILGISIIVVIGIIMFFLKNIIDKIKDSTAEEIKQKRLPEAKDTDYIIKKCQESVVNTRWAELIPFPSRNSGVRTVGENPATSIYHYEAIGIYTGKRFVILMNMHFPDKKSDVLINPNEKQIIKWLNYLAEKKDKQPNEKVIETENAMTGTKQIVREKTYEKEKKKDEVKKKGDLE